MRTNPTQEHSEPSTPLRTSPFNFTRRWLLGITVGLGILGTVAVVEVIHLLGMRDLSQLELILFSIIIAILQILFGLITGWWFAAEHARSEYRPFVRSALERIYGLVEGLERVQDSIRDGKHRMAIRPNNEATPLLWEEIMNILSAQSTSLLRDAEASIKDWLQFGPEEIAREEIARLEQSRRAKDERIAELMESLQALRDLKERASGPPAAEPTIQKIEMAATSLEEELQTVRDQSILAPAEMSPVDRGKARRLRSTGAYVPSIEAYSRMIESNPTAHSFYVGRARAKYLAGDQEGALADLDIAQRLQPRDATIGRARQRIIEGKRFPSGISLNLAIAAEGHAALAQGQVEEARRLYTEAKGQGINPAFAKMNLAMVELVGRNTQDARKHLDEIDSDRAGPYMRVQLEVLQALCIVMDGVDPDLDGLRRAKEQCPKFAMSESPLQFLEKGLEQLQLLNDAMRRIFDSL